MFMDTYSHSIDAKGRLSIPSKLREELSEDFIITKSADHCLSIYPKVEWEHFKERMDALPRVSSEAARRLRRFYFGNSSVCEVDKAGRILISSSLRAYADIKKEVVLVGVDDHVEIWDKDAWENYNKEVDIDDILYGLDGLSL